MLTLLQVVQPQALLSVQVEKVLLLHLDQLLLKGQRRACSQMLERGRERRGKRGRERERIAC